MAWRAQQPVTFRDLAIGEIQLKARRLTVRGELPAAMLYAKTDAELMAWLRRLAVIEFEQKRAERFGLAEETSL